MRKLLWILVELVIKMKVVHAELDEEEYKLLKEFVDSRGVTIKED